MLKNLFYNSSSCIKILIIFYLQDPIFFFFNLKNLKFSIESFDIYYYLFVVSRNTQLKFDEKYLFEIVQESSNNKIEA